MAQAKKTSLSQKVVKVSTSGMPAPIQSFLGNRLVSKLIILITPVLFACGLLSMEWENGFPKFSVNREKATEVKQQVAEKVQELRENNQSDSDVGTNGLRIFTSLENLSSGSNTESASDSMFDLRPIEHANESSTSLFGERSNDRTAVPTADEQEKNSLFGNGPISSLKQRFENRR